MSKKKILEIDGNILDDLRWGELDIVLHAMNLKGSLDYGFSRQLVNAYPVLRDIEQSSVVNPDLGDIALVMVKDENGKSRMIANMYCIRNTPSKKGYFLSLKALKHCIDSLNEQLQSIDDDLTVGFIKMGSGYGGRDWDEVKKSLTNIEAKRLYNYT